MSRFGGAACNGGLLTKLDSESEDIPISRSVLQKKDHPDGAAYEPVPSKAHFVQRFFHRNKSKAARIKITMSFCHRQDRQ